MTPVVRRRDALEALVSLADSVRGKPFEWGVTDCGALFLRALACLDEDGDRHLARLTWSSLWGAHKALESTTPALLLTQLGAWPVDLVDAAAGDLVLGWIDAPGGGLPTCHVAVGSLFLTSSEAAGVVLAARHLVVAHTAQLTAWRV